MSSPEKKHKCSSWNPWCIFQDILIRAHFPVFLNSGVSGCNIQALQFKSENGNINLSLGFQEHYVDFNHLYRHGRQLQNTFDHLTCYVISVLAIDSSCTQHTCDWEIIAFHYRLSEVLYLLRRSLLILRYVLWWTQIEIIFVAAKRVVQSICG